MVGRTGSGGSWTRGLGILMVWQAVLTVAVGALFLRERDADGAPEPPTAPEVAFTPDGFDNPVVRLAGALPDPQVGGRTFPRSNVVAGLQFTDAQGNELGGLGTIPEERRAMMLCFDHQTAEAVCLTRYEENVTFTIMEPPAEGAQVGVTGPQRFAFGVRPDEGLSYLHLMDREGRARVRLVVGADGQPAIETLDEDGRVTARMP